MTFSRKYSTMKFPFNKFSFYAISITICTLSSCDKRCDPNYGPEDCDVSYAENVSRIWNGSHDNFGSELTVSAINSNTIMLDGAIRCTMNSAKYFNVQANQYILDSNSNDTIWVRGEGQICKSGCTGPSGTVGALDLFTFFYYTSNDSTEYKVLSYKYCSPSI